MTDNTWLNTNGNGNGDTDANWSLGVAPDSTHRMVCDTTGAVVDLPGFNTPRSVGAIFWNDGVGGSAFWNKLTCLGECSVDGSGFSADLVIFDIQGGLLVGNLTLGLSVLHLTGSIILSIANGDCSFGVVGTGGTGTITWLSLPTQSNVDVSFTGTLIANGVVVDLAESVLSPSIRLQTLNGGSFTNYTGGPVATPPRQSGLSLGLGIHL
jgi:hypothetical protein